MWLQIELNCDTSKIVFILKWTSAKFTIQCDCMMFLCFCHTCSVCARLMWTFFDFWWNCSAKWIFHQHLLQFLNVFQTKTMVRLLHTCLLCFFRIFREIFDIPKTFYEWKLRLTKNLIICVNKHLIDKFFMRFDFFKLLIIL